MNLRNAMSFGIVFLFLAVGSCLLAQVSSSPAEDVTPQPDKIEIQGAFHIIGIPSISRNARVDVTLAEDSIVFARKTKTYISVPLRSIVRFEFATESRHYGKTAYGAAVATSPIGGVGALGMLVTNKVDALALVYRNERGGEMNLVVQMPSGSAVRVSEWLASRGVVPVREMR